MQVIHTYNDILELASELWAGALDTFNTVYAYDKHNELFELLKELFYDSNPTITDINDFLWFDSEYIFEQLGITTESEDDND